MKQRDTFLALGLIIFGVVLRFLPHLPNFAPLTALAIFSGAILPRKLAVAVPLLAAIISDLFLGTYGLTMFVVWACYGVIALAASQWCRRPSFSLGLGFTIGSSLFFFIATNFAVWAFGTMYPHTIAGLQQCYILAIPFFRNSLLGDLTYATLLFGLYAGAQAWVNGHAMRLHA